MYLVNVETYKLEEFIGDTIPPYAILSHTWGADADELCKKHRLFDFLPRALTPSLNFAPALTPSTTDLTTYSRNLSVCC